MSALLTRTGQLLAHDGRIAGWLLAIWRCFLIGVSFLATAAPLLVFHALVGWQATHLAIALFGLAVVPLVPGVHALLVATERLLDLGGGAGAGRAFWAALRSGARRLSGAALAAGIAAVVLSYDIALVGHDDALLLAAIGATLLAIAALLAVSVAAAQTDLRGVALVSAALTAALRRPHIVLCWLLLAALGAAASGIPLVGPSVAVFASPLVAISIHICNRALGFGRERLETETS